MSIVMCNRGYCKSWADDYIGMYAEGEECPACTAIIFEAKKWFTDTMIQSGIVSEDFVVQKYRREVLHEPVEEMR